MQYPAVVAEWLRHLVVYLDQRTHAQLMRAMATFFPTGTYAGIGIVCRV